MNANAQIMLAQNRTHTLLELCSLQPMLYRILMDRMKLDVTERLRIIYADKPIFLAEIPNVPVPFDLEAPLGQTVGEAILAGLEDESVVVSLTFKVHLEEMLLGHRAFAVTVFQTLKPNIPLEANPFWFQDINAGEMHLLGQVVGLTCGQVENLLEAGLEVTTATNENLRILAKGKTPVLSSEEASNLSWVINVYHFFNGNIPWAQICS